MSSFKISFDLKRCNGCGAQIEYERELDRRQKIIDEREAQIKSLQRQLDSQDQRKKEKSERYRSAIQRAIENGAVYGRPRKKIPEDFPRIYEEYKNGKMTIQEAADALLVSSATFYRWARSQPDYKKEK